MKRLALLLFLTTSLLAGEGKWTPQQGAGARSEVVKGYAPQDGMWAVPQTYLSGVVEKHTDAEPFDVPDKVLAAATGGAGSQSVPVNFLADADTTGRNSGSPVVNGKGELVGVNFDRVWENVANDFAYNPELARNISVDVCYLLWMLEVEKATELLQELKVAK